MVKIKLTNKGVMAAIRTMMRRIGKVQLVRTSMGCVAYAGFSGMVAVLHLLEFNPEELEEGKEYTLDNISAKDGLLSLELTQWPDEGMSPSKVRELKKARLFSVVSMLYKATSLPGYDPAPRFLAYDDLAVAYDILRDLKIDSRSIVSAHGVGTAGIVLMGKDENEGIVMFFCSAAMNEWSEFGRRWGKGGAEIKEAILLLQPMF